MLFIKPRLSLFHSFIWILDFNLINQSVIFSGLRIPHSWWVLTCFLFWFFSFTWLVLVLPASLAFLIAISMYFLRSFAHLFFRNRFWIGFQPRRKNKSSSAWLPASLNKQKLFMTAFFPLRIPVTAPKPLLVWTWSSRSSTKTLVSLWF